MIFHIHVNFFVNTWLVFDLFIIYLCFLFHFPSSCGKAFKSYQTCWKGFSQSVSQSASQPVSQPASQPASQSFSQLKWLLFKVIHVKVILKESVFLFQLGIHFVIYGFRWNFLCFLLIFSVRHGRQLKYS